MKIVAASDLHGHLPEIPACDLAIIAGDVAPWDDHDVEYQRRWLRSEFSDWLSSPSCLANRVVLVAGNHDFAWELGPPCRLPAKLTYLQDSSTEINGLKIYGTPWVERRGLSIAAFGLREKPRRYGGGELAKAFAAIPDDVDVLVTHMPPARFGDQVLENTGGLSAHVKLVHIGSPSLLYRIEEVQPRLAIFGHVHEGHGRWQHHGMTLANVSLLDEQYQVAHAPQVFELVVEKD